jgi:hypothetical protein
MTKFIKAVKGNVSAVGRLFSEGVVSLVTDEVGASQEITQMEKLGYLKVFDTQASAMSHSFTGIAALARSGNVSSAVEQSKNQKLKADEAKAIAQAAAKAASEEKAVVEATKVKLTASEAKAAAKAAPTSIEVASPVTAPAEEAPVTTPTPVPEAPATPEK